MFEEMLPEDTKYLEEILTLFNVSKYKLSETPTRFKIIINPTSFSMKTLHSVQDIRTAVGIEVDLKNGVFIECLKTGASRKKRRIMLESFRGDIPTKYNCEKFNSVIRFILGIEDICAFDADVVEEALVLKNIECLSFPILKQIEQSGFDIFVNMTNACIRVTCAKAL